MNKNSNRRLAQPRVLHATSLYQSNNGILHQIAWEQEAASRLGIPWRSVAFCPKDHLAHGSHFAQIQIFTKYKDKKNNLIGWLRFQLDFYRWIMTQEKNFDLLIIRYSPHDPILLLFILNSKSKVFTMHHTLEGPELSGKGLTGKLRSSIDNILSKLILRKTHGICAVTNEILNYELTKIKNRNRIKILSPYPNGVEIPSTIPKDLRESTPELIFIASKFSFWQGLDLILNSIGECKDQFILHLVGDLDNDKNNPALKDSRVMVHGQLNQESIKALSERCWVGLSAFALYRKGMKEACPLKVREYLSLGLPVYAGHKDCFPVNVSFFVCGPARIIDIVQYAHETRNLSREEVINDAGPYISKDSLLNNFYENIGQLE